MRRIFLTPRWWARQSMPRQDGTMAEIVYINVSVGGSLDSGRTMTLREAMREGLLEDVRTYRDHYQRDVAEATPFTRNTISRWENGAMEPSDASLELLEMLYLLRASRTLPKHRPM